MDPQVVAVSRFRQRRTPGAVMPPVCTGAPLTYPLDCLTAAMKAPSASRGTPRNPDEVELEIQADYMAEMTAGMSLTDVGVDV